MEITLGLLLADCDNHLCEQRLELFSDEVKSRAAGQNFVPRLHNHAVDELTDLLLNLCRIEIGQSVAATDELIQGAMEETAGVRWGQNKFRSWLQA